MYRRILLALDASESRAYLISAAKTLGTRTGARVLAFHVRLPGEDVPGALAASACAELEAAGVEATCETVYRDREHVAMAILGAAKAFSADLVVMGSRALSEFKAVLVGSVSHDVIIGTAQPVLLIPTRLLTDLPPQEQRRVLIAIESAQDLQPLLAAVEGMGGVTDVVVLHVRGATETDVATFAEPSSAAEEILRSAESALADRGLDVRTRALLWPADRVGEAIAGEARSCQADVIVVGSRRRGAVVGLILGSTARDVLHHSDRPVLIAARPQVPH